MIIFETKMIQFSNYSLSQFNRKLSNACIQNNGKVFRIDGQIYESMIEDKSIIPLNKFTRFYL
ncbi:hypothetical protein HanIR_Chr11g0503531 [Helianthus annuus]|nr:hypothetical protein HanIR_Chr11g0503531 [Helianthus annuus]